MGIDIYARWNGQSEAEIDAQHEAAFDVTVGRIGYLREAYHGEPYATTLLCAEAFESRKAEIPAAVLKERLPAALALVETREKKLYKASEPEVDEVKQSFRDFVALCERKEKETGKPVEIVASF